MAHKTFISYKYSEAQKTRDAILEAMGEDAVYYQGETSESPDLTDTSTENIKRNLRDMMYGTSVTIVVISPEIKKSKWIDWEIEYSLKKISRNDRTSHVNGIVGVIQKVDGGYDWFKSYVQNHDGHEVVRYKANLVYDIINNNRFNQNPKEYACKKCRSVNELTGSYISYVEEEKFLNHIDKYIENAFKKSQNDANGYDIKPTR